MNRARRRIAERGTAIVETTMVLSILTLLIFGTLTMAIIGYQQLTTDAGSFYAARTYALALGSPTNSAMEQPADTASAGSLANAVTGWLFPHIGQAKFKPVLVGATGIGSIGSEPGYTDQTARHGGVTLVAPQGQQVLITTQTAGLFSTGQPVVVPGVALEPDTQIINPEFNIAGQSTYNNQAALAAGNAVTKYFGTGMDAPPYFMGHNYMLYCTQMVWQSCGGSQLIFRAFGNAETLDANNWNGLPTIKPSTAATANAFEAMLCHQRVYAQIAQTLFASATRPAYNNGVATASNAIFEENPGSAPGAAWKAAPLNLVYGWDAQVNNGTTVNTGSTVGATPVQPLKGCQYVQY